MLSQYLDQIYALPHNGDLSGLVDRLTKGAGAHKSLFQVIQPGRVLPDVFVSTNILEEDYQPYFEYYYRHNIWMDYLFAQPNPFGVWASASLVPREVYESSIWYNEFAKQNDIFDLVGPVFPLDDGRIAVYTAFSRVCKPEFEQAQSAFIHATAPHLQRAVRLHMSQQDLRLERDFFASVSKMPRCARLLLDKDARLVALDERSEQIIRTSGAFRLKHNHLSLRDGELQKAFATALRCASDNSVLLDDACAPLCIKGMGRTRFVISCDPFQVHDQRDVDSGRYVLVSIHEPEPLPLEIRSHAVMQALYGFTSAEARIAVLLLEGKDPAEAAESLGISKQTVRQHLKSVLRKTGTHRQSELIAQLLRVGCA